MIEKILNLFGYFKKDDTIKIKQESFSYKRDIIGKCDKCGADATAYHGFRNTIKLCNTCSDIRLGLD